MHSTIRRKYEEMKFNQPAYCMSSSGEVWISYKIAELARRCGVSPCIADIVLAYSNRNDFDGFYTINAGDGDARTPDEEEKVTKVHTLLGLNQTGQRRFDKLSDVEAVVDDALSLAPRARVR